MGHNDPLLIGALRHRRYRLLALPLAETFSPQPAGQLPHVVRRTLSKGFAGSCIFLNVIVYSTLMNLYWNQPHRVFRSISAKRRDIMGVFGASAPVIFSSHARPQPGVFTLDTCATGSANFSSSMKYKYYACQKPFGIVSRSKHCLAWVGYCSTRGRRAGL